MSIHPAASAVPGLPEQVGPYRIRGMLGRGGMGVVYLGEDAETGQAVALKTVLGVAEPLLASLRREIHALSRLRHPGVVRILAEGTCGGLPWYAMEFLQGGTLRDRVDALRARRAPLVDTLTLVRRLCEPLAFLHGHGIVHRDLKPENVFIQPDGTPVLVDFGLSAQFSGARGREVLALGDENSGSDAYIAPEQILGEFVDARADLYALGCILYDLLTGQPPFVATGGMSVLAQHLRSPPVPPSRRTGGLPEEVDRLVLRLLEKKPRDRLGYADDVAAALVALGAERPEPGTSSKPQAYLYRPDFLGRAAVLERLQEPLRRARNHQGGQLFIGGESGVGKTRLAMELAAEAKVLGLTVIAGECQAFGPALRGAEPVPPAAPLHPLRPFLLAVADKCREQGPRGTDQLLGPRGRLLAAYEPTLAELPGQQQYPAPSPLPSDAARRRLLSALRATLRAFAAASPLLLILDDLQWADELTLHLLRDLQEGGEPGVLIVGTYRLEEMGEVLQEVVRAPGRVQVTLDRLASEHVGAMVRGMLALSEVPWTFTEFLIRHSSGNPFFVAEYLRSAMAQGLLYRDRSGAWLLAERGNVNDVLESSLPMPGSLAELIQRRLAVLDAPVRALAQWASVLGREFDNELLLNGAGVDEAAGMEAIEALRLRQVLEDTGTGRLRFVHDKLRETTYAELTAAQLLALHRRAAEAIERRGPVPPGQYGVLAQHWARAQEHAQAGGWFTRAGEQARATYANDEAIGLFRAALQEFRALPPAEATRALQQLHESLGELLAHTGRQEEARESLGAALALLPEHERLQRARLHRKLGKTWEAHHRYDEALSLYGVADSCLGAPPAEGSASAWWQEWVQLQFERVSVSYFSARMDEGNALIERLRPVVEAQGTTLQRVHLFRTLIQSGLRKDRYLTSAQTVGYARACLAESEKTGEVGDIFNTRFALGFVLLNTSEQSAVLEAEELLLETLRGAERFGDLMLQARCLAYLTLLYRRLNRAEETRRFAERCKPIAASGQFSDYLGLVRACLAWSCWREQRLTEAEQEARAALELWRPLALVYPFQWTALLPLAAIELQRGQLEDAVARVHAALEPRQQLLPEDLTGSLERVRTSWRDGQHGAAGEHLLRALELARARGYL